MGILDSLDAVRSAPHIVDALRLADQLAYAANLEGGARTVRTLASATQDDDQVLAIASVHALAQVTDYEADDVLSELLSSERPYLREHAAWALGSRLPRFDTVARLIGMIIDGSFTGMLAQRTLQGWAGSTPQQVAIGLESALIGVTEPHSRFRLVETLGLVPGRISTRRLLSIAADANEADSVRVAALAGLGDRSSTPEVLALVTELAAGTSYLADGARLAWHDLTAEPAVRAPWQTGLTVAQLFLHADIDHDLTRAGSGDNGGIATLLVRLGDALTEADSAPVQRVITLSRGSAAAALESLSEAGDTVGGHGFAVVPLLSEPVPSPEAWPLRVAAERGIRRILNANGGVDVLHLRMADVGSLAASAIARELDIPVVFTVAPDPHGVIQALENSDALSRTNFGEVDAREHFWFRARLVQRLAADAAHTVLFPRPDLANDMRELVGIDITAHPEQHTIVAEGIDLEVVDRAVLEAGSFASGDEPTPALAELRTVLEALPASRRDLPLIVSVGRLHRVKGMATIVEAWASGPLREQANLLLIGGDLVNPSPDEREQLDRIDAVIPAAERDTHGLLLPGHHPNDTVARWVAAARFGVPGFAACGGIYVCGSLKEEFGIALLEGMAAGLMVVAPNAGGPATFVEQGDTGILTRTSSVQLLRAAMATALDRVASETSDARAIRSRETVERSFTIQAMASTLTDVYAGVHTEAMLERQLAGTIAVVAG